MIETLQKSYLLVVIAIIMSIAITFVLNIMLPQKDEKKTYTKAIVISGIIATALVYIHTIIPRIEEIITTPVPF